MKKLNQFYTRNTFYMLSALLLAACGSSGGGTDPADPTLGASIVPLTCSHTTAGVLVPGIPTVAESGSDGGVFKDCEIGSSGEFGLTPPSMHVTNVIRHVEAINSCDNGVFKTTTDFDYQTAVLQRSFVGDGVTTNCTENYEPFVPLTISDSTSINHLLEIWGEFPLSFLGSGFISSDCPTDTPQSGTCTVTTLRNYEITDDGGTVHKLATKLTTGIIAF